MLYSTNSRSYLKHMVHKDRWLDLRKKAIAVAREKGWYERMYEAHMLFQRTLLAGRETYESNCPAHTQWKDIAEFKDAVVRVKKVPNKKSLPAMACYANTKLIAELDSKYRRVIGWRFYTDIEDDVTCADAHAVVQDTSSGEFYCATQDYPEADFFFVEDASAEGCPNRWVSGRRHPHYPKLVLGRGVCKEDDAARLAARASVVKLLNQ